MLLDCSLVATIVVIQGDSDDGDYYASKSPPPIAPMTWGVPKHPLRPAATKQRKQINHFAPFTWQKPRPWLVDGGRRSLEAGLLEIL